MTDNMTPKQRAAQRHKIYAAKHRVELNAKRQAWRKRNPELTLAGCHRQKEADREAVMARRAIGVMLAKGKISRPEACGRCGTICRPEGHHPDYEKRLEVLWLCKPCHAAEHRRINALMVKVDLDLSNEVWDMLDQMRGGKSRSRMVQRLISDRQAEDAERHTANHDRT